jgi:hypothetical protein
MATFVVVHEFINNVLTGKINASSDTFKFFLTNSTPTAAGTQVKADLTPITPQNGYAEHTPTVTFAETGAGTGIWRFSVGADKTWTATTGGFGPFRYAVVYDDTPTSPADPIVGYVDYGSAITINDTETFTLDFDANFSLFTAA